MELSQGDTVTLRSEFKPMVISSINAKSAWCVYTGSDGKHTGMEYPINILRKITPKEIEKHQSAERKREDAKAGATWFDKIAKLGAIIGASGAIILSILTYLQQDKITELKNQIEKLSEKINTSKK